ncbi:hypothetical protein EV182_006185 [Spiromyces aspiralis]|uniref:Uncharacterized protein n=1 Tax=Spiromyces aspiralis TaxID=68401 RepID=A0ACC1HLJ4_9FUNG|nr:hypothetical protein EV182_006185 [Spiromyces aspiralis]
MLRRLNVLLFPVRYTQRYYQDVIGAGHIGKLGAMSVIANQQAQSPGSKELYLMTLGVLAPYRNVGIGSYLLDWVIQQARGDSSIGRVVLHVHTENTEALQFYSHRKFRCIKTVKDYYRNLDPPNAYLLAFDTPSPPNPRRKATVEREEPVVGAI